MKRFSIETGVGIFVLIGIFCIGLLTIKVGKGEWMGSSKYNDYNVRFQSVAGLKAGAEVQMAGVTIGKVDAIGLDIKEQSALVTMKIRKDLVLTDDVIASIKTSGLIGDKYVKLTPGGSDEILAPGDFITETESAIDIEEMVSNYVFGSV